MRAETKIKLDRTAGGILVFLLNLAARVLGFILRRNHRLGISKVKVVCVSKYAGLGSILCAGPLLLSIKNTYPESKLVFISSQNNASLLECLPIIDIRLYVSERSILSVLTSTGALLVRLWKLRPEIYLDLEIYSYYSSMIATLSCARNRYGFYRKSATLKKGSFTHLVFFNTVAPIRSLYLQLGRVAGCRAWPDSTTGLIRIPPEASREAAEATDGWLPADAPLLIVNPNASDLLLERRWPLESFAAAIGVLMKQISGLRVGLVGSRSESEYVSQLSKLISDYGERTREFTGLPLPTFLALLQKADCFLSNDSGPMHMAFDFEVPTVALFGPASPFHLASYADRSRTIILYAPVLCSPCIHNVDRCPCDGDNQCMKRLEIPNVVEACLSLLNKTGRRANPQEWHFSGREVVLSSANGSPLGKFNLRGRNFEGE